MKKALFLILLLIFSCKKEAGITETTAKVDSVSIVEETITEPEAKEISNEEKDSIVNNAPATKEVLRRGVMREVEGNKIIRIADADLLPFTIGEEFEENNQEFILKIKNFSKEKLSVSLKPQYDDQNIRINQIKLPNGTSDGPFGRELKNYEITEKGEVWLIIGKNNMASGESKGNFSINIE